jgi:glycine hydroxymethyltransferase
MNDLLNSGLATVDEILSQHEEWRGRFLNMIAAENLSSDKVRQYAAGDLAHRYGCYFGTDIEDREYRGNRYLIELERAVQELACSVFRAEFADLRPLAGHMAGVSAILGLTSPQDTVMEVSLADWGHGLAVNLLDSPLTAGLLRPVPLPVDEVTRTVDPARFRNMIADHEPRLVILGTSGIIFPDPVSEIVAIAHESGASVIYDGSHVLGLIGSGTFPNPLNEGADGLLGSTHKTFFGPQGGIVLTRNKDILDRIASGLFPAMVTNHHLQRLPALAAALTEIARHGDGYGRQVVANSKRLASALSKAGFTVIGESRGFSETHIILVDVAEIGKPHDVTALLEEAGITACSGFEKDGVTRSEIRLGTAELTRRGFQEIHMEEIAGVFARLLIKGEPASAVANEVADLARSFTSIAFAEDTASGATT